MNIDKAEEHERDAQFDEIANEVFEYLDELRESGETNMFGAHRYVMETFDIDKIMAIKFVASWMENHGAPRLQNFLNKDFINKVDGW